MWHAQKYLTKPTFRKWCFKKINYNLIKYLVMFRLKLNIPKIAYYKPFIIGKYNF